MNDNPYAVPQAKLVQDLHQRFRWKPVLAAATVAFLLFPAILLALAVVSGMDPPDFLLEPGFLLTLALISLFSAFVLERIKLRTWLYCLITTVVTLVLFVGTVVALRAITR